MSKPPQMTKIFKTWEGSCEDNEYNFFWTLLFLRKSIFLSIMIKLFNKIKIKFYAFLLKLIELA